MTAALKPSRLRGVRLRSPHTLPPTRQRQRSLDRDIERRRQFARERLDADPNGPDAETILDRFRRRDTGDGQTYFYLCQRYADLCDLNFDDGRDDIYERTGNI